MSSIELTSPSYEVMDIKEWAEANEGTNDIARRLINKYFKGSVNTFKRGSFYFITFTNGGGVILKKDPSKKMIKSRAL